MVVGAWFGSGLVSTVDRMDRFASLTTGFLAERKVRTHKHSHTFHSKKSSSIELHWISSCKKRWTSRNRTWKQRSYLSASYRLAAQEMRQPGEGSCDGTSSRDGYGGDGPLRECRKLLVSPHDTPERIRSWPSSIDWSTHVPAHHGRTTRATIFTLAVPPGRGLPWYALLVA
mgnify:FL=1